jgi:hypothetical protein
VTGDREPDGTGRDVVGSTRMERRTSANRRSEARVRGTVSAGHFADPGGMPKSSRGLTNRFQVMLYTSLGNVSLSGSLEAVHLLGALAGHDLDCGPLVDDLEVSRLDKDVDDLAAMSEADMDPLAADDELAA